MASRAVGSARSLSLSLCVVLSVSGCLAMALVACGGSKSPAAPSAPTTPTTPSTPTPPSNNWSISGQLVAYGNGRPINGAHLTSSSLGAADTDGQGAFQFSGTSAPTGSSARVSIAASNYVTREASLQWARGSRTGVALYLIPLAAPFSMDFYRQLVRNTYDAPATMEPLRRWTDNPRFYVQTVDDTGRPIEPEVLALVVGTIPRAVQSWTGGKYSAVQIDQGVEARPAATGWINVLFKRDPKSTLCGQARVAGNPGQITLWDDRCSCGSIKVPAAVVVHEMGHAMGFWHVADRHSVMYPTDDGSCETGQLSTNEQFHSALAYTRSPGNVDPDSEPTSTLFSLPSDESTAPVVTCPAPHRR